MPSPDTHPTARIDTRSAPPIGPVEAYWHRLRGTAPIPARAAFDPDAIGPFLGQSGMLERRRDAQVAIRLAGRRIEHRFGMALRGLPLHSLVDLGSRARLVEGLDAVFDTPALGTLTLIAPGTAPGDAHRVELALFPMADAGGAARRALMVMAADTTPRTRPERLILHRFRVLPVDGPAPHPPRPTLRLVDGGLN